MSSQLNQKKVAKNTLYLYIRMLMIMVVQFYTVRITLQVLGMENYGISNVVSGVTHIFTFLTHTMTSASQRFFAFDLGRKDLTSLKNTYGTMLIFFVALGLISVLILEGFGNWMILNKLVIPNGRLHAAFVIFQISLFSLFISMSVLPFNSLIIAHEDMKTFAYVSIIDVFLRLAVVYMLQIIVMDKLILYSMLNAIVMLIAPIIYIVYCFRHYEEVTLKFHIDFSILKKIVPYMSWNLIGGFSWMLCTQGLSIVVNMFFGPLANAAKGIADKINTSVNGFVGNFMTATQPQIIKTYASGDMEGMYKVFFLASNISFYLMLILAVPVILNGQHILTLWLGDCDELTLRMMQLVLCFSIIGGLENPINQAIRATGDIRNYQVYIGLITLLVIPVCWIFFKLDAPAYYSYVALISVYSVAFVFRLYYLRKQVGIGYKYYFDNAIKKQLIAIIIVVALAKLIMILIPDSIIWILVNIGVDVILSCLAIFSICLSKSQRELVKQYALKRIKG